MKIKEKIEKLKNRSEIEKAVRNPLYRFAKYHGKSLQYHVDACNFWASQITCPDPESYATAYDERRAKEKAAEAEKKRRRENPTAEEQIQDLRNEVDMMKAQQAYTC